MSIGGTHETAFTRAAQEVLEHLSDTFGQATWALCRGTHHGGTVLAVSDPLSLVHAHTTYTTLLGTDSPDRVTAAVTLPDGQPFAELVGFGHFHAADMAIHPQATVRVLADLLGALAAAEITLAAERRSRELSDGLSDPLTGLATRQGWEQRLRRDELFCREFGEPAAVMIIELDELKRSNEMQGHSAGDEQLRLAGAVLREVLADHHFAARVTGDRLGAVLIGVNEHEVGEFERLVRQSLAGCEVSTAIGIGRRVAESGLLGAVVAADEQIAGTHGVRQAAAADAGHVTSLLEAMERGAIRPYFQPIVDLRTGDVVALEALARWHSPDGVREPDQFLPMLQQAGLLGALFDRMLDEGLRKLVEFRAISPELRLAVNFEFDTKPVNSLLDTVRNLLQEHALPANALSLELSERQTFELPTDVRDELFAIADLGVQLMLDDFGTGFASLETLTSLPISGVKLDRRFTGQVVHGERESIVVKAMIALAAETGLSVIAEGIETQQQCDRLVRMGCRLGQGYFFALPQPADSLAAVLAAPLVSTF